MLFCRRSLSSFRIKILVVLVGFFSVLWYLEFSSLGYLYNDYSLTHPFSSHYPGQERYISNVGQVPVTAIVTTWHPSRFRNLKRIIQKFGQSKYIDEIIVWNNNEKTTISMKSRFTLQNGALVRVIQSKNIKTLAKYTACLKAKNSICLIYDDDWLPMHLDPFIFSFYQNPTYVHILTNPITKYMEDVYRFLDTTGKLHSQFAWLGSGSIFLKTEAMRFLELLNMIPFPPRYFGSEDLFFSIYVNRHHIIYPCELYPLEAENSPFKMSGTVDYLYYQSVGWMTAVAMARKLAQMDLLSPLPWTHSDVSTESRTFCHSDDLTCLFVTNVIYPTREIPVPDFDHLFDNKTQLFHDLDQQRFYFNDNYQESDMQEYIKHPEFHAVDTSYQTFWKSPISLTNGSYFGIDYQTFQFHSTLALAVSHLEYLHSQLRIRVLVKEEQGPPVWKEIFNTPEMKISTHQDSVLVDHYFYSFPPMNIRYIQFVSFQTSPEFFRIHHIVSHPPCLFPLYSLPPPHKSLHQTSLSASFGESATISECSDSWSGLVIGIFTFSTEEKKKYRIAIRSTWGRIAKAHGVSYRFLVSQNDAHHFVQENEENGDFIFLSLQNDSYSNLLGKTLAFFQWAISSPCSYRFVMKADDDSYLYIDRLLRGLEKQNASNLYMGYMFEKQQVYHSLEEKNYEPYLTDYDYYPRYASGSGYILSAPVVQLLLKDPSFRYLRNEDAAIGFHLNHLNQQHKLENSSYGDLIDFVHNPNFFAEPPEECVPTAMLVHRMSLENLYHQFYFNLFTNCFTIHQLSTLKIFSQDLRLKV